MKSLATIKLFIFSLVLTNILQRNTITAVPACMAKLLMISNNPSKVEKLRLNPEQFTQYKSQENPLIVHQSNFAEMKACPFCELVKLSTDAKRKRENRDLVVQKCEAHRLKPIKQSVLSGLKEAGVYLFAQSAEIEMVPFAPADDEQERQEEGPSLISAPIVSEKLIALLPFSPETFIKEELTTPTKTSAKLGTIAFFIAVGHLSFCLSKKIYRSFRPNSTKKELEKIKEQLDSLQNSFLSSEDSNRF